MLEKRGAREMAARTRKRKIRRRGRREKRTLIWQLARERE